MANRYTDIKLHIVFAFKRHDKYIPTNNLPRIFAYIASLINNRGHRAIQIGGMPDHIHILMSFQNLNDTVPALVRDIKRSSTEFINSNRLSPFISSWQDGYSCFSVNCYDFSRVRDYIINQQAHHTKQTLRGEMKYMLDALGYKYDEQYLFE